MIYISVVVIIRNLKVNISLNETAVPKSTIEWLQLLIGGTYFAATTNDLNYISFFAVSDRCSILKHNSNDKLSWNLRSIKIQINEWKDDSMLVIPTWYNLKLQILISITINWFTIKQFSTISNVSFFFSNKYWNIFGGAADLVLREISHMLHYSSLKFYYSILSCMELLSLSVRVSSQPEAELNIESI